MIDVQILHPEKIRTDGGTQMRAELDATVIDGYAQDLQSGARFPPLVVYYDGENYWLGDGFHRLAARKKLFEGAIECEVRSGTRRDAVLCAAGANAAHGLRRNNADKRRAVETLLRDEEWRKWSDREIARACGVSQPFVSSLRPVHTDNVISMNNDRTFIHHKTGQPATMQTANIGRVATPAEPPRREFQSTTPAPRPLTDEEAQVVVWRAIKHNCTTRASQPTAIAATRRLWLIRANFSTFRDMLNPGVTLPDSTLSRAIDAVADKLATESEVEPEEEEEEEEEGQMCSRSGCYEPATGELWDGSPVCAAHIDEPAAAPVPMPEPILATIETADDSDEYYTPDYILEPARKVLGCIDVDPASCAFASEVIKSLIYFDKTTNGLQRQWNGNVWLNPPYSNPLPWIEKLFAECTAGRATAALVLVNTANSPQWARLLWQSDGSVCLLSRRVRFWRADQREGKGFDRDQMIWYFGANRAKFRVAFEEFGAIR